MCTRTFHKPTATVPVNLADVAVGIAFIYHISQPDSSIWDHGAVKFGLPYFTLSVSLNILLTIMVVSRLVLHVVNIRNTMGVPARASGLYQAIKAIVIVLVESSALYSANSLLFIGSWGTKSPIALIFLPILAETQVSVIFPSPRSIVLTGYCYLILITDRPSLHCLSFGELQTGAHWRMIPSFPGIQ